MSGRFDHQKKKAQPDLDGAEAEQEEAGQQQTEESQEQTRGQTLYGNQAVASLVASRMSASTSSYGVEPLFKTPEEEIEPPQLGGDDDPFDDGPLTITDLVRSWNPRIQRTPDRTAFTEPMPEEDLPPEQAEFLAAIRTWTDVLPLPPASTLDALLQPSAHVMAGSMSGWARAVAQYTGHSLSQRTLGRFLLQPPPALQDPYGRVLLSRARVGALGTWLLLDSPLLGDAGTPGACSFVSFCLELAARLTRIQALRYEAQEREDKVPVAAKLLADWLPTLHGQVRAAEPTPGAGEALLRAFAVLLGFRKAVPLVPDLLVEAAPEDPEADPLGLDSVLNSFVGEGTTAEESAYKTALLGAERLAAASARTRVDFAAAATVLAEVSQLWSSGSPGESILSAIHTIDRDVQATLKLLVEIARAAKSRAVKPKGLHNGLMRAAKMLDRLRMRGTEILMQVAAGVVPGRPELGRIPPTPSDGLAEAWACGQPNDAVKWIRSLEPSPDRDAALTFALASAGSPPDDLVPRLRALHHTAPPMLAATAGVCLGPCLLWTGRLDEAVALADRQLELGRARRNGLVVAEAALLAMESHLLAGRAAELSHIRHTAGNLLWRMGARSALTLLARWTPPDDEDAPDLTSTSP